MKLTSKDRSLILFIIAFIIVIWASWSVFSYLTDISKKTSTNIDKISQVSKESWINVASPLKKSDLKNRIILLKFWYHSCAICVQDIDELHNLKDKYGDNILIIPVHSPKFNSEKSLDSVRKAVAKYNITFPVIADSDYSLAKNFSVESLPKYILINPLGKIVKSYDKPQDHQQLSQEVANLVDKFRYRINKDQIALKLENNRIIKNVLNYPDRLAYTLKFKFNEQSIPAIFISNIGDDSIVVSSLDGKILHRIGGGDYGFEDGAFDKASFNNPRGMIFDSGKLYVADSGNNAIRVVDFKKKKVSTIIGDGKRGKKLKDNKAVNAKDFSLFTPLDIAFFPNNKNLVIANSGANQILSFDVRKNKIKLLAGSGKFDMVDGKGINASLAQTFDIETYNNLLYFVDSKSSSLRSLDKSGQVTTLVGSGLDKFGHRDGDQDTALMQNPTALAVDDTGIYIIDNFNNSIRRYSFDSKKITDYQALKQISKKSDLLDFDEPSSIISLVDRFYISDSNNNRIVLVNRTNFEAALLDILPQQKNTGATLAELEINKGNVENIKLSSQSNINLKINLQKGWKINDLGPSELSLFSLEDDNSAKLINSFSKKNIIANNIKIDSLDSKKKYVLQGYLYFCENKDNALCYVKDYKRIITVEPKKGGKEITINLGTS